jgi:peptidoglycan/LPS O-acetylase OafA/YrhL
MAGQEETDRRLLPSGDEAGTPPDDRAFRPDVEGLRAVAVLLVVLYHEALFGITGGWVGVDVFFVISGFVITGLLLRERQGTDRTSILDFYARRCRRILPAALLVILVVVLVTSLTLGHAYGSYTADDGRWNALFLANFHSEALTANPMSSTTRGIALLGPYWSLSVEEQFYFIYPLLFVVVASLWNEVSLRVRLAVLLAIVVVSSFMLNAIWSVSNSNGAYFSPFARAWELALGALVAVGASWLKRIPGSLAAVLTWAGLGSILFAALISTPQDNFRGVRMAFPAVGAALIIAGGVAVPRWGAEAVLGLLPVRWLGKRSYSLYLWHWPVLIGFSEIAGRYGIKPPMGLVPFHVLLIAIAMLLSMVTYRFVENPIRHWKLPPAQSIALGFGMVALSVAILSVVIVI